MTPPGSVSGGAGENGAACPLIFNFTGGKCPGGFGASKTPIGRAEELVEMLRV